MRIYRETITVTATNTFMTVSSTRVASGYIRIYEGRVIQNFTGQRGVLFSTLVSSGGTFTVGYANLSKTATSIMSGVGISEEAGHRHYGENEYWTFGLTQLATGDVISISLMGTEVTVFEYTNKLIIPS